jgi:hypothetical protein
MEYLNGKWFGFRILGAEARSSTCIMPRHKLIEDIRCAEKESDYSKMHTTLGNGAKNSSLPTSWPIVDMHVRNSMLRQHMR